MLLDLLFCFFLDLGLCLIDEGDLLREITEITFQHIQFSYHLNLGLDLIDE